MIMLLSGAITMVTVGIIPYKHMLIILTVIPLIIFRAKIPNDQPFLILLILAVTCFTSAIVNQISFLNLFLFLRNIFGCALVYYLIFYAKDKVGRKNLEKAIVFIAAIQLPVVIVQKLTYEFLPSHIIEYGSLIALDYDFGTFKFKGDPNLSFFLCLLTIYCLFNNPFQKIKNFTLAIYSTVTIFIVNSQVNYLIIIVIWVAYFLKVYFTGRINSKKILLATFSVAVFGGLIYQFLLPKLNDIIGLVNFTIASDYHLELFEQGKYSRLGAVLYFLKRGLIWIGDGPGVYFNPITEEYALGTTGHMFTFYAEIGIIGLMLSYLFFVAVINKVGNSGLFTWSNLLILFSIVMMSLTVFIYSDISFLFITGTFLMLKRRQNTE